MCGNIITIVIINEGLPEALGTELWGTDIPWITMDTCPFDVSATAQPWKHLLQAKFSV